MRAKILNFRPIYTIIFIIIILSINGCQKKGTRPRVIVTTDIQKCCENPDDIQSLCHLLWYADELDIKAIIPQYFNPESQNNGVAAVEAVIDNYELDFENPENNFREMGFPEPEYLRNEVLFTNRDSSINKIISEALKKDRRPLYVLNWGDMELIRDALLKAPDIAENIRLISMMTNLKDPSEGGDGAIPNINGAGRNRIFGDPRFDNLWWIENDWGYKGMIEGIEYPEEKKDDKQITRHTNHSIEAVEPENVRPVSGRPMEIMNTLATNGGNLGKQIQQAVSTSKNNRSYFFRAADTPSVLYIIDQNNDPDDPSVGSWAGLFMQPFPEVRPNYWTNVTGDSKYDHTDPINTWRFAEEAIKNGHKYMVTEREEMYQKLLEKLNRIYGN